MTLILAAAAALAGCASSQASTPETSTRLSSSRTIEIEDDGIAVQTPPLARRRREPDDPSQPYSPNYGRAGVEPRVSPPVRPIRSASADEVPGMAVTVGENVPGTWPRSAVPRNVPATAR